MLIPTAIVQQNIDTLNYSTSVLTNAQIKALPTTPVEILAAGATDVLIPLVIVLRLLAQADYTNINAACELEIRQGLFGGLGTRALQESTGGFVSLLLAGGAPGIGTLAVFGIQQVTGPPIGGPLYHQGMADAGFYDSDIMGQSLTLDALNGGSGNFTGGDAANTLTAHIYYTVITI